MYLSLGWVYLTSNTFETPVTNLKQPKVCQRYSNFASSTMFVDKIAREMLSKKIIPQYLSFSLYEPCLSLGWVTLIFYIKGTPCQGHENTIDLPTMLTFYHVYQHNGCLEAILSNYLLPFIYICFVLHWCFINVAPQVSLLQLANNKKDSWWPCVLHIWTSGWCLIKLFSHIIQPGLYSFWKLCITSLLL